MTTAVTLTCPQSSHWHVKVDVRTRVYDHENKKMTDDWTLQNSTVLKQGESQMFYIHDTCKLEVSEIVPDSNTANAKE